MQWAKFYRRLITPLDQRVTFSIPLSYTWSETLKHVGRVIRKPNSEGGHGQWPFGEVAVRESTCTDSGATEVGALLLCITWSIFHCDNIRVYSDSLIEKPCKLGCNAKASTLATEPRLLPNLFLKFALNVPTLTSGNKIVSVHDTHSKQLNT